MPHRPLAGGNAPPWPVPRGPATTGALYRLSTPSKSATAIWMITAFGISLVLAMGAFAVTGTEPANAGMALRLTARWSFLLFWLAYAGGAIAALAGPALAPLAGRGRQFGLAFASAHLVHIGLVVWLYWATSRPPLSGWVLIFFAIGTVWIYLLAALSFGSLSARLGPKLWHTLRILGMNYILLAFARDFVPHSLHMVTRDLQLRHWAEYMPFAAMSVAAPVLTFAAAAVRRRRRYRLNPAE